MLQQAIMSRLQFFPVPTFGLIQVLKHLFRQDDDEYSVTIISLASSITFLGSLLIIERIEKYILRNKGFVILLGLIEHSMLMELNHQLQTGQCWSQQINGLFYIYNFFWVRNSVKWKIMAYLLPSYSILRLSVFDYTQKRMVTTESIIMLSVMSIIAIISEYNLTEAQKKSSVNEVTVTLPTLENEYKAMMKQQEPEEQMKDQDKDEISPEAKHQNTKPYSKIIRRSITLQVSEVASQQQSRFQIKKPQKKKDGKKRSTFGNEIYSQLRQIKQENQSVRSSNQSHQVQQIQVFITNILNYFPYGIVLIDQDQKIKQMNDKVNDLLDLVDSNETLQELIKLILSSEIMHDKVPKKSTATTILEKKLKRCQRMNDREDLLKEIFSVSSYCFSQEQIQGEAQKEDDMYSAIIFLKNQFQHDDKVRCYHIEIHLCKTQSPQRANSYDVQDSVLLIIIKNLTQKDKLKKLKKESEFQRLLLQSFSHELRTPLNCSVQMLTVASQELDNKDLVQKCISEAINSNFMLIYQLNDILDFAAWECGSFSHKWGQIEWNSFLNEIEQLYTQACVEKNIELVILNQTSVPTIQTDRPRLTQVIVNLLNNSLKYTPQYGTITLRVRRKRIQGHYYVKCSVMDTGQGMDPLKIYEFQSIFENQNLTILESLMKTKKTGVIGLGLNISNKIIQGLAEFPLNFLHIKQKKVQGIEFYFFIEDIGQELVRQQSQVPQSDLWSIQYSKHSVMSVKGSSPYQVKNSQEWDNPSIKSGPNAGHIPQLQFNSNPHTAFNQARLGDFQNQDLPRYTGPQVLIVDDVPFNHMAIKRMFNSSGIEVDHAYDGYQAILKIEQILDQYKAVYRLILMDVEMPGINGFYTTKQILTLLAPHGLDSNIIMCSAYDTTENYYQAQISGMKDILSKPVKKPDFQRILQQYYYSSSGD